jgi:EF-hand domain-containing protein 1
MLDRGTTEKPSMAIPLIPGLVSTQRHFIGRTNFHKGQLLEQMAHGRVAPPPTSAVEPLPASPSAWLNVAEHHRLKTTATTKPHQVQQPSPVPQHQASTKYRSDATQPKWITHDRQVLRFFGYFTEPIVVETHTQSVQQDRVRRVVLVFYLSDHSLAISEPRVANSGLAQGEFLKRTVATAPSGSPFEPEDFNVGGHVRLYGRKIHLVDCDEATRTFYDEVLGQPQPPPRKYPDDRSSHVDEIELLKQRLQQRASAAAESRVERVRKFHELSQRVLRFFVSWRDPHPLYPETRQYVLHYYLCDDTMEIVEPRHERQGRGHFAVLLSRRRMVSDATHKPIGDRDLRCGDHVHVFSRRFLLQDCDAFTRDYYLETHGITQETFDPEQSVQREKAAKWKLFQVDPSELLARVDQGERVQHLRGGHPHVGTKATAQRFYQNDTLDNKQLRFRARFHECAAQDPTREFVLTYFLEDDTLAVFEPRVKNSGVAGGRFLDRGRFRKCVASESGGTQSRELDKQRSAYRASDFYVGAVIRFEFAPQQKLELIEADRQTLAYCESHPEQFPYSDGRAVLQAIAKGTGASSLSVRRAFRGVDAAGNGSVPVADVRRVLETISLAKELNAQQLVTLCRKYEDDGGTERSPGPFLYDDFCDALALQQRPASTTSKGEDVYDKLRKCSGLRSLLREADKGRQRVVDGQDLMDAVATAYKVAVSHSEVQAISSRFAGPHRQRYGGVDYNALCDRVFDGPRDEKATHPVVYETGRRERGGHHPRGEQEDTEGATQQNQYSLQGHCKEDAHSDGDLLDLFGDEEDAAGDACSPDEGDPSPSFSPRRLPPRPAPLRPVADARVVALLRRVFGDRKYQLRKALRDRDVDKSSLLGEEAFMEAVLAVEPRLSDDDTYLIADAYFPTNNSHVDYTKLLETAFRS